MPMLRDGPPPLPADVVRDLRNSLAPSYGHRLVDQDGRLVCVVRVPGERVVPDRDIAACADVLPEEEVAQARDVLFIADEKLLRVDPIPVRDAIRERLQSDAPTGKEVRRAVDREWGATLFQPATRRDVCVGVRVPRASYRDLGPHDLERFRQAVQPVLGQPQAAKAGMCYIVADNDYRRCTPDEFARLLRGESPLKPSVKVSNYAVAGDTRASRAMASSGSFSGSPFGTLITNTLSTGQKMEDAKRKPSAAPAPSAPAPAAPLVQLAPPGPAPAPTPPAAPAPSFAGLVQVAQATPPPPAPAAPAPAPAALPPAAPPSTASTDALLTLGEGLQRLGFEVMTDVGDLGIALAAHQPGGKRIVVQRVPSSTPEAIQAAGKLAADLEADAALLVADDVPAGSWLAAAGTRVEVLHAGTLAGVTL
jgi:hypothetical protein